MSRGPSNWPGQVNAWPVAQVAPRLGLDVLSRGNDTSFPCPVCLKNRRHSKGGDPRHAAKVMPNNRWWCEPCGANGDAVALACAVAGGTLHLDASNWREVKAACIAAGLAAECGPVIAPFLESHAPTLAPASEVAEFWARCLPIAGPCASYLEGRGFNLARATWAQMVRAGPKDGATPSWWPAGRLSRWPLMFPAYDARGSIASLQGRSIASDVAPKTLWPKGHGSGGLLFADAYGANFLAMRARGEAPSGLEAVVLAEGGTDTLKLACALEGLGESWATLGYVSGSKAALAAINWPGGLPCIVATDDDAAGDRYAAQALDVLRGRARVFRVRPPQGRGDEGRKRGDWADLPDAEVLAAFAKDQAWEVLS